ncbi:MAG: DUF697 domain-containing protein [Gammaproteobacteria bacterium]|nr:DUF697 domain-containing protein [Gammaproteobacteria bacterium]MBU2058704.1 DUF697 domain-containing protein [Gammaproteobacteria bacterium]MBU2177175.1 DUF697 domain-containing protein [Gammaproteobacteria bacterium]MBU2246408.1 DUF697 domain-containing protein [Gammaproteobacteria bacterium]MBU2342605.1 DUF697 domain-containing protein [Gammaproteobacteria bacterium]
MPNAKTAAPDAGETPVQTGAEAEQKVQTEQVTVEDKSAEAEELIRKHSYAAAGVGLIPIPWVDFIGLTAIQIKMLHQLSETYKIEFSEDRGKAIIGSLISGFLPVAIAQPVASFIKAIPLIGQTTGAITMSILGGSTTYAIGRVFNQHFASGGTFLDLDPTKVKAYFKEQFEVGRTVTQAAKKETE